LSTAPARRRCGGGGVDGGNGRYQAKEYRRFWIHSPILADSRRSGHRGEATDQAKASESHICTTLCHKSITHQLQNILLLHIDITYLNPLKINPPPKKD